MTDLDDDLDKEAFFDWLVTQSGTLPRDLLGHYLRERGHDVRVRLPYMCHNGEWKLVRRFFPYQLQFMLNRMDDPLTPGMLVGRMLETGMIEWSRTKREPTGVDTLAC